MSADYDVFHEEDLRIQDEMEAPFAYLAKTDEDTMYFDQAMAAPDRDEFIQAVVKEVNAHIERKHWELVPRSEVPEGTKVLDAVWSMKRK